MPKCAGACQVMGPATDFGSRGLVQGVTLCVAPTQAPSRVFELTRNAVPNMWPPIQDRSMTPSCSSPAMLSAGPRALHSTVPCTLTVHRHRVRWKRIHTQCLHLHSPAAELCTAQSDRQLTTPGISSNHWKVWQAVIQTLPPDAGKAAVGAYEHPGAVCSFAAPAAAEAHRHAAGRLLVAAA
jgi:hypothetical protein